MEDLQDGILLRAFIGEADRKDGQLLYRSIVDAAHRSGLAGATALMGPLSFGHSRAINSTFNVDAPGNLPMVVEIIDTEDKIDAFLPELDKLIGSGLVTLEKVRMARVGRGRKSLQGSSWKAANRNRGSNEMEVPHDAVLLRIFMGTDDRYGLEPLYMAVVMKARELHLAGATVLNGPLGFGQSSRLHKHHLFSSDDSPVVIEICDAEDKIDAFLPVLDEMMENGLVTLEKARVLQYGRTRVSTFARLKKSVLG